MSWQPEDTLLLCSDGLTEMVPDDRIAALLEADHEPRTACERLVAEANELGGKDNISVIMARFESDVTTITDLHRMKTCLPLLVAFLAFAGDDVATSKFKITTKKKDDSVEVRGEKDKVLFIVKSPFGISQAAIERQDDKWPGAVKLRLHLKGLSNFRASTAKVRLDASVSIQEGKQTVRMWKDGKEDVLLDEKSPLWISVRIVGGDGKPAKELPLKDGYIEMGLPKAFFAGNPKSITVNWIDFYRN
jgi:hypothetical protein